MCDLTGNLPIAEVCHLGPHDLFTEIRQGGGAPATRPNCPPLLFIHGAFTGSWMWAKYVPHFIEHGVDALYLNLRGHYRSRSVDLSRVTFGDYVADIALAVDALVERYHAPPILVGFSMGGLLGMKIAESTALAGLVLIDSSICSEVHAMVPYRKLPPPITGPVVPAPLRPEEATIDETADDIAFQRKYLSLESASVVRNLAFPFGETGISLDGRKIACPTLVITAIGDPEDDVRGKALAQHIGGEHRGFPGMTHTGLLVGQRYGEVVASILAWLDDGLATNSAAGSPEHIERLT